MWRAGPNRRARTAQLSRVHRRAPRAASTNYERPPPKPPSKFQPPEARSLAAMDFGGNWCLCEVVRDVGAGMIWRPGLDSHATHTITTVHYTVLLTVASVWQCEKYMNVL
jgi:hypothetical protein